MEEICFIDELKKLKMSSKEAVDNIDSFSEFKRYMHVERKIENELLDILRNSIDSSNGKLILVCGSAGDGKSHLLSFLLNEHPELANRIQVHNDATESFDPQKTSLETLNEELSDFKDENIECCDKIKVLLINLGTLTNFVDSKYGEEYRRLRTYVEKNNILIADVINTQQFNDDKFAYVNFADYHMFSLTEDGVNYDYINNILNKITENDERNIFYTEYKKKCSVCHVRKKCPIKENYELIGDDNIKAGISSKLVEIMIKEKASISTRAIMNFVYDIIVHPEFNSLNKEKFIKKIDRLNILQYIDALTSNIMFTNKDSSRIIKALSNVDPILCSNENIDDLVGLLNRELKLVKKYLEEVYPLEDVYILDILKDDEYINQIIENTKISKIKLQSKIIEHYIRLNYLSGRNKADIYRDDVYNNFIKYLYLFNTNNVYELGDLYDSVSEAVYKLDNVKATDNNIRIYIGNNQNKFKVFQKLYLECDEDSNDNGILNGKLDKFLPNIILDFIIKNTDEKFTINLDYKLYELLTKVRQGYVPKKKERNDFISFIDSIEKIKRYGQQNKEIYIKENVTNDVETYKFTKKFGKYKFERIK